MPSAMQASVPDASASPTKACSRCFLDKPLSAFGTMRRRGRVDIMAECRECKKARDRKDSAKPERAAAIKANRNAVAEANKVAIDRYRAGLSCTGCCKPGTEAVLDLVGPRNVSLMVTNGLSLASIMAVARECQPYCRSCRMSLNAARRRG